MIVRTQLKPYTGGKFVKKSRDMNGIMHVVLAMAAMLCGHIVAIFSKFTRLQNSAIIERNLGHYTS